MAVVFGATVFAARAVSFVQRTATSCGALRPVRMQGLWGFAATADRSVPAVRYALAIGNETTASNPRKFL